ncbi:hypothetical protein [Paenibacillus sp. 203]|uniref:hypothetical protein n=1 Tax=Paenibacillus sp. 203 TaxID=3096765 RepID=UPI00300AE759
MKALQLNSITETTMCSFCWGDLAEIFDKNRHNLVEDAGYEVQIAELGDSNICEVCSQKINSHEDYYIVTVDDADLMKVVDEISKLIGGCEHCEGSERGHLAHNYNKDLGPDEAEMDVSGESLSSYLSDQGVSDNYIALFAGYVNCPRCGSGRDADPRDDPNAQGLDVDSEIFTVNDVNFFWGDDFYDESALHHYCSFTSSYGFDVKHEDLTEFGKFLIKHPTMGTKHPVGDMFFQAIKLHKQEGQGMRLKPTLDNGMLLYRGRSRKEDSTEQYPASKMWSPPEGNANHGRYNAIGVPVLYLTNDLEAVPYEIHTADDEVIDIASFEIKKELLLFDIGVFDQGFEGFFEDSRADSRLLKHRYLLPNFIGASCSLVEYDGVNYTGVREAGPYTNYALFTQEEDRDVGIIDKVKTYKQTIVRTINVIESIPEENEEIVVNPEKNAELPF